MPKPSSVGGSAAGVGVPRLPRQRSTRVWMLGLALVVLGALIGYSVLTSVNRQVSVLVAARDVPVGMVVSAADVGTAKVSADSAVTTIPASQRRQVVGTVAAVGLRKGTLLGPAQFTTVQKPETGQQLVSVALKSTQVPARGLQAGDLVAVTATPALNARADKPLLVRPVNAVVDRVKSTGTGVAVVVDLIVADSDAVPLAQQASTGQIALLLQPRRA